MVHLREGCVVMLLRNLRPADGLCNGTRMIVKAMHRHVIECEILDGSFRGHREYLPRIVLSPSDIDLPVQVKRWQFPVKVSYAMSINKAQGQTLHRIAIYLPDPCFSHGQRVQPRWCQRPCSGPSSARPRQA